MPRTPPLSLESLVPLGAEKLAALVLTAAANDPAFRKRVVAALAGAGGAGQIAKMVERRLSALERARAMVPWEKERALAADLGATLATIVDELAPRGAAVALGLLLRFIATHNGVFGRIDDSSGRIQAVYHDAVEAVAGLVPALTSEERELLPDRLLDGLSPDSHGLCHRAAARVAPLLPPPVLDRLDAGLSERMAEDRDAIEIRLVIADVLGDVDRAIALEPQRPEWRQDPLAMAERLLAAGRLDEALAWCRRVPPSRRPRADMGPAPADARRTGVEARILEARGEADAAQALRWDGFGKTLDAALLREHVSRLGDFDDEEALDRAFAIARGFPVALSALTFLLDWPRPDEAARLVLERVREWDGGRYDVLPGAAAALAEKYPAAATVLYRALLDDILSAARSSAYGHAAQYFRTLQDLAGRLPNGAGVETHDAYVAGLRQMHGRKAGFWSRVREDPPER